mgnify:CR=1 FL=1
MSYMLKRNDGDLNMKFRWLLLISVLFLSSCVTHKYALSPIGGNTNWDPKEDSAVILIGILSDKYIDDVSGKDEGTNTLASALYQKNHQNIIALHRKVGDTFQLEKLYYSSNISGQPFYKFDPLPTLIVDSPGLYYYGSIKAVGNVVEFSDERDEKVISMAKVKFHYLFKKMNPINFK